MYGHNKLVKQINICTPFLSKASPFCLNILLIKLYKNDKRQSSAHTPIPDLKKKLFNCNANIYLDTLRHCNILTVRTSIVYSA